MTENPDNETKPAEVVPPGSPDSGQDLCPDCGGHGERDGKPCPGCEGTGTITEPVGPAEPDHVVAVLPSSGER